jgi:predicted secreted protein
MRRTAILGPLMVCLACGTNGAAAGGGATAQAVTLDANGTTVSATVGRTLTLRLRNLGDGGYQPWVLAAPPDPAVLRLTSSSHEEPGPGALLGNFGQDVFTFQALAPGLTKLVATATRPWQGGGTETFKLSIVVR